MSITLNVYAKEPLRREELAEGFRSPAVPKEYRWELRFVSEDETLKTETSGALGSEAVLGWHPDAKRAADVRAALARKDRMALRALYQEEAYGRVSVSAYAPADDDWAALTEPDFLESIPEAHREVVKAATVWYELATYASRNRTSLDFQEQLWRMMGAVSGGVLEDPQEGEWESCAEEE